MTLTPEQRAAIDMEVYEARKAFPEDCFAEMRIEICKVGALLEALREAEQEIEGLKAENSYKADIINAAIAWRDSHPVTDETRRLSGYLYDRVRRYQDWITKQEETRQGNNAVIFHQEMHLAFKNLESTAQAHAARLRAEGAEMERQHLVSTMEAHGCCATLDRLKSPENYCGPVCMSTDAAEGGGN